jgi:hypothetical protein
VVATLPPGGPGVSTAWKGMVADVNGVDTTGLLGAGLDIWARGLEF